MEKIKMKYVLAALVVVLCGMIWYGETANHEGRQQGTMPVLESVMEEPTGAPKQGNVYVHITGAVKKPGVYIFDEPPRVIEVVEEAGGFTKDAVKSGVNQAEIVEDGVQIVITSKRDAKKKAQSGKAGGTGEPSAEDSRIDLNTATKEELMTLPGIGESKAVSIVAYRETNGNFKKIEDVMNITGIKDGIFEKIKDRIKV